MESTAVDEDDDDLLRSRKSLYFSGCLSSPCSIVPSHGHQYYTSSYHGHGLGGDYSRIRRQINGEGDRRRCRTRQLWRRLVRKLLKESKSLYGSAAACNRGSNNKRLTFQYDAVSYKQNFDDEEYRRSVDPKFFLKKE